MNEGDYTCIHYWWDQEEREYTFCAVWHFEKNYPDMPDYWHLISLEIQNQEPRSPDLDLSLKEGSNIWQEIERQGPSSEIQEVDYI